MSAVDNLLDLLPQWTLVVGKGGVGKTTTAASLAARAATRGERTLLLATDPARALTHVVGIPLGNSPAQVPGIQRLFAAQLDPEASRIAFLERWRAVLLTILDRGTYFDAEDAQKLVDTTLPGGDETFAVLTLAEIARDTSWDRMIVDTAPTGHTLRLLALPDTLSALVRLFDAFQEKHRMLVRALARRYRADEADAFLAETRQQVDDIRALLHDGRRLAAALVTRDEPVVIAETQRYARALSAQGIRIGAVITNASAAAAAIDLDAPFFTVPALDPAPAGLDGAGRWSRGLAVATSVKRRQARGRTAGRAVDEERRDQVPLPTAAFTIVAGKGGVGKTTVACAIALELARHHATLLVSTDPAPSIADALELEIGDVTVPVLEAPGLFARQLDAAASFARFREQYSERVGDVMKAVAPLANRDEARMVDELMALAPPGIDELYALAWIGEELERGTYERIVLDPAPTGHLLRLLEVPGLALAWTHQLMRLQLKYREVVKLGDAAEELLAFARRTRGVQAMLTDADRATAMIVSLDEPLVRNEAERLATALGGMSIPVNAIIWNRVGTHRPAPLVTDTPLRQYALPAATPSPRGVEGISSWFAPVPL